jgi:PAS domain S-box-containing protein
MSVEFRQHELLRLAVDLSPAGMLVVDGSGTILLVNREIERLFGYERDELIGKPVDELVPERLRGRHPAFRAHYMMTPAARPMGAGRDLHGLRKDGTEFPVEIGLNPIHTDQGFLVLGSVVDITARRAMENQLRQSQKLEAIGTLAGGIAHDFNNLLHGIVGHTELLLRRVKEDPQLRADLDQILRAAERGRQLVQRILTFSRQSELPRVPTRLDRPIREALGLLRASLPRTIEIREALDPETPAVLCDETQVQQVVMNLATNAAHAMEEGGELEVTLAPFAPTEAFAGAHRLEAGVYAHLRVRDSGHGMTAEVLERAREPFFTTKPPGKGSGLGLSMIHGMIQSLGGVLEIASQPGQGTRVDIYLRASETGRPATIAAAPGPIERDRASSKPHVLVVEDEKDFAVMLGRQLEAFDYRATVHTSSLEALEDFRARPDDFDVLMTDNTMPRMTGLALAREIRRIRPELPVLMISGLAEGADPAALEASGINRVLRKPHTGREMDEALRQVLVRP